MSNLNKSAELAELKQLHANMKNLESTQKRIASVQSSIKDLSRKTYSLPSWQQLSTDSYEKEANAIIQKNQNKKNRITGAVLTVAILGLVIMGILWLCMSGIFTKNTYLHTPEIIREYSGVYYNVQGHERNCKITITSCKENGKFEGTFEFFGEEAYTDKPFYGKYSVTGKVTTKSAEGHVNATLEFKEWIERPSGWDPLKDLQLKIYDDYQVIRCFDYNMCLYASDYKKPATAASLKTPEIIGTYSGKFTPPIGKTGDAILTIETCDENGFVTGLFEYTFELAGGGKSTDKCTWNGQITKKYDNGSLVLTLEPDEDLASGYMFYDPTTMEIEIYDNYRSVDSMEGIHWFYEGEGFKKDPAPVKTPTQQLVNKVAPIAIPAYIVVALVILVILSNIKTDAFTSEQQRRLDQLLKQDSENRQRNEAANKKHTAQAKKEDAQRIADYKEMLASLTESQRELQQEINRCALLGPDDKKALTVESLIYRMETNRADSVKEALLQLDESNRRFYENQMRMEMERQERDRRIRAEADARWNQAMHNMAVEKEQRRQAEELEKIRKALED